MVFGSALSILNSLKTIFKYTLFPLVANLISSCLQNTLLDFSLLKHIGTYFMAKHVIYLVKHCNFVCTQQFYNSVTLLLVLFRTRARVTGPQPDAVLQTLQVSFPTRQPSRLLSVAPAGIAPQLKASVRLPRARCQGHVCPAPFKLVNVLTSLLVLKDTPVGH